MNKQEMIIGLINLYDENERLKAEIEVLKHYQNASNSEQCEYNESISLFDRNMIEYGKKQLLEDCLYSWGQVSCDYDEESKSYNITSYERWINKKVSRTPDFMSKDKFKKYFEFELREMYEKEKQEAIEKAKEEMKEGDN